MKRSVYQVLCCLAFVCTTLMFSACGSKLTNANLEKIKIGMTTEAVEEILGKPTKIDTQDITLFSTTQYNYQHGKDEVRLTFVNNKLITKSGTLSK